MTDLKSDIHDYCVSLGAHPPKIVVYSNGTLIALRNGDGDRVAVLLDPSETLDSIKARISQVFKVQAGNQPSQETLNQVLSRKDIQAHQQARKFL